MPAENCLSDESRPWAQSMDYEHEETIKSILEVLSCPFFRRDTLHLVEREEIISVMSGSSSFHSLMLYGRVGPQRQEALLQLIRRVRLSTARDMVTSVAVGVMLGDVVPALALLPLERGHSTESFRRWRLAARAMHYGMLENLQQQRQRVRERLERLLRDSAGRPTSAASPSPPSAVTSPREAALDYCRQTYDEVPGGDRMYRALDAHLRTAKDPHVDIAHVAATAPTLFVAWSQRSAVSLRWLRAHLFTPPEKTVLPADVDPWLDAVAAFVPPLARVQYRGAEARAQLLRGFVPKRAHIVLVNVDASPTRLDEESDGETAEKEDGDDADAAPPPPAEALEAYAALVAQLDGWRSREVSLLSLWAGPEGLLSEFSAHFRCSQLPLFVASTGASREPRTRRMRPPRIVHAPQLDPIQDGVLPLLQQPHLAFREDEPGPSLHRMEPEQRARLLADVGAWLAATEVPLSLTARLDTHYDIIPHRMHATPRQALGVGRYSSITLSGLVSDADVQRGEPLLRTLLTMRGFTFSGKIIRCCGLPMSPARPSPREFVLGIGTCFLVVCSVCAGVVVVERETHYRCLQCPQSRGVCCARCFGAAGPAEHDATHQFVRLSAGVTPASLEKLVWGPANVTPYMTPYSRLRVYRSLVHCGVRCNECRRMIEGVRWKCAACYSCDLCAECHEAGEKVRWAQGGPMGARKHNAIHPVICIPVGRQGNNNVDFLRPIPAAGSLEQLLGMA